MKHSNYLIAIFMFGFCFYSHLGFSQEVEVQGALKVMDMTVHNDAQDLVVRKPDGTFATRSVATLPPPAPEIDTTRNLASDYELAKQLCDCPNLPPFMIKKLLASGYTEGDLAEAGVPVDDIRNAAKYGSMVDPRNNKYYKTVKIGTQVWMAENLNIGTRLEWDETDTDNGIIEKFCPGNFEEVCDTFGGLYTWTEIMNYSAQESIQGICPVGWHIPSDAEFNQLEIELGLDPALANTIGQRGSHAVVMAGHADLWNDNLIEKYADFGLSGLDLTAAGFGTEIYANGYKEIAYFWTSTVDSPSHAMTRVLVGSSAAVLREIASDNFRMSVRCVKD